VKPASMRSSASWPCFWWWRRLTILIQFPTTNRAGSRVSWGCRTRGAEQIPFLVLDGRWRESTGKNGGTHLPEGKWGINGGAEVWRPMKNADPNPIKVEFLH
jgi:hypothetical protein